jgi:hypothetical protein
METLIIEVASEEDALAQAIAAVASGQPQRPRYLFVATGQRDRRKRPGADAMLRTGNACRRLSPPRAWLSHRR